VNQVEDVVKEGDALTVKVREIDSQGKISLEPVWGDEDEGAGDDAPEAAGEDREQRPERGEGGDREGGDREGGGQRRRRRRRPDGDRRE
jgi:polyribonucleotide nucleotidyltransferase